MDKLVFYYKFSRYRLTIIGSFLLTLGILGVFFGSSQTLLVTTVICLIGIFLISIDNQGDNEQ